MRRDKIPERRATVRNSPCASCPYRKDVPSGVWARSEYEGLRDFDGEISDQAVTACGTGVFFCHQADGKVCAGWAGHRPPYELLGVRLGVAAGFLDTSVLDYTTDVPLFCSGAEAAEHGTREIEKPSAAAMDTVSKIRTVRELRGDPLPEG